MFKSGFSVSKYIVHNNWEKTTIFFLAKLRFYYVNIYVNSGTLLFEILQVRGCGSWGWSVRS